MLDRAAFGLLRLGKGFAQTPERAAVIEAVGDGSVADEATLHAGFQRLFEHGPQILGRRR